jgi:hypothetical protein
LRASLVHLDDDRRTRDVEACAALVGAGLAGSTVQTVSVAVKRFRPDVRSCTNLHGFPLPETTIL